MNLVGLVSLRQISKGINKMNAPNTVWAVVQEGKFEEPEKFGIELHHTHTGGSFPWIASKLPTLLAVREVAG